MATKKETTKETEKKTKAVAAKSTKAAAKEAPAKKETAKKETAKKEAPAKKEKAVKEAPAKKEKAVKEAPAEKEAAKKTSRKAAAAEETVKETKAKKKAAKAESEAPADGELDDATKELFSQKIKEILALAKKKKNVLEYAEISDFFADMGLNEEQLDNVLEVLENSGIDVLRVSDDVDDLPDDDDAWQQPHDEDHVYLHGCHHARLRFRRSRRRHPVLGCIVVYRSGHSVHRSSRA